MLFQYVQSQPLLYAPTGHRACSAGRREYNGGDTQTLRSEVPIMDDPRTLPLPDDPLRRATARSSHTGHPAPLSLIPGEVESKRRGIASPH